MSAKVHQRKIKSQNFIRCFLETFRCLKKKKKHTCFFQLIQKSKLPSPTRPTLLSCGQVMGDVAAVSITSLFLSIQEPLAAKSAAGCLPNGAICGVFAEDPYDFLVFVNNRGFV